MLTSNYKTWESKPVETLRSQEVSLDDEGGYVRITLKVDGHQFSDLLDAHEVGEIIQTICVGNGAECCVCGKDLVVAVVVDGEEELHFAWSKLGGKPEERKDYVLRLTSSDIFVFEEALKSYCRMLMRPRRPE